MTRALEHAGRRAAPRVAGILEDSLSFGGMTVSRCIRVGVRARSAAVLIGMAVLISPALAQTAEVGTSPDIPLVLHGDSLRAGPVAAPAVWRFHPVDDPVLAGRDVDDAGWELAHTGLQPHRLPEGWQGIGWFRLHLYVDSSLHQQPLGIEVQHLGASEAFLNGRLVAQLGRPHLDPDSLRTRVDRRPRPVVLPAGHNVLAVRYAGPPPAAGEVFWPGFVIRFVELDQMTTALLQQTRRLSAVQFFFVALFAAFAMLHLAMFSFHRASTEHLWFGLLAAVTAALAFGMMQFTFVETAEGHLVRLRAMSALLPAFGLLFLGFTYTLFYDRLPRLLYAFLAGGGAVAAWVLVSPGQFLVLFGFVVLVCFEVVRATVLALLRGRPGARVLGFGLGVLALATVFSLLAEAQLLPMRITEAVNPVTGATVLVVAMSIHLSRKVARTNRDLELQLEEVRRLSEEQLRQERAVREERIRAERISAESRRRAAELEEARQIQLSMLPRELPQRPDLALDAYLSAATEVGGDYYDVATSDAGTITIAVGDATGHGMRAGTVVTAAKSLFWTSSDDERLDRFLTRASAVLGRMGFRGLYMGLLLARWDGHTLQLASAGMPPVYIWRSEERRVETVTMKAMPLGGLRFPYEMREVELRQGDVVLLASDGFAERFNAAREEIGYTEAARAFERAARTDPGRVIEQLVDFAEEWAEGSPPNDDMTLLTLRMKCEGVE